MFRFLLVAALTSVAFTDKLTDLAAKLNKNAIPFFSASDLKPIIEPIIEDSINCVNLDTISENFLDLLISKCPANKYIPLIQLMSKMDSCLTTNKCGTKTMEVLGKLVPAFTNKLKPAYKKICAKGKKMRQYKKSTADQMKQGYTIGFAAATKNLVQKIFTASSKKLTAKEWVCACENAGSLFAFNKYNTKRPS